MDKLGNIWQKDMMKGLKDLPHEEGLRNLELVSLEKRCHREELINVCKHLKGGGKEGGSKLYSLVPRNKIRDKSHQLKHRMFTLNISKHFLTVGISKHQHRFSSE